MPSLSLQRQKVSVFGPWEFAAEKPLRFPDTWHPRPTALDLVVRETSPRAMETLGAEDR